MATDPKPTMAELFAPVDPDDPDYMNEAREFMRAVRLDSWSAGRAERDAEIKQHIEQEMNRAEDAAGLWYPQEEHCISAEDLLAWIGEEPPDA